MTCRCALRASYIIATQRFKPRTFQVSQLISVSSKLAPTKQMSRVLAQFLAQLRLRSPGVNP